MFSFVNWLLNIQLTKKILTVDMSALSFFEPWCVVNKKVFGFASFIYFFHIVFAEILC